MNDEQATIAHIKKLVDTFIKERDWDQFYDAKSMCMNISVEASELMELFTWAKPLDIDHILQNKREAVEYELADIFYSLLLFCNKYNIDLSSSIHKKMVHNAQKYPVHKARGMNKKYNEL